MGTDVVQLHDVLIHFSTEAALVPKHRLLIWNIFRHAWYTQHRERTSSGCAYMGKRLRILTCILLLFALLLPPCQPVSILCQGQTLLSFTRFFCLILRSPAPNTHRHTYRPICAGAGLCRKNLRTQIGIYRHYRQCRACQASPCHCIRQLMLQRDERSTFVLCA